jgi:hypothetical protein
VQLGTETFVGAGHYMMEPDQLARYRAAVLDEETGTALAKIVGGLERAKFTVVSYDELKKVPRGMDPEHPRARTAQAEEPRGRVPAAPEEADRVAGVRRLARRARRARAPARRVAREETA